jgi:hypothetical protein
MRALSVDLGGGNPEGGLPAHEAAHHSAAVVEPWSFCLPIITQPVLKR